jgi:hypothetical protein
MSSAMAAAIQLPGSQPSLFVAITFASATVYMWTGTGSVTWGGHTWLGMGSLMEITAAEDAATVEARGISITLSGLNPTIFADCQNEFLLGQPVVVYLGLWSGGSLVASPIPVWAGRTDQPTFEIDPEQVIVTIACENRLADMNVAVDRRLTNQDQQMDFPGDLGFQFVDALQEQTLFWGTQPNTTNNI